MAIEFNCHLCGKLLRTADEKAGRTAKCPGCGESIAVPDAGETDAADDCGEEDYGQDDSGDDDYGRSDELAAPASRRGAGRLNCPMCGKSISDAAAKCRFCGEDLGTKQSRRGRGIQPTQIEAGEVISTSWEIYKSEMGICIGGVIVAGIINAVASAPSTILQEMMNGGAFGQEAMIIAAAAWFVLYILGIAVQLYMTLGVNILLLNVVRGQGAEIGDLFKGGPYFLRMLGSSFLFGLAVGVGTILCIVPGIIVALMFWPYAYLLVDKDPPGIDCLSRAKEITENNWGAVFLIGLVSFGINLLGLAACCVGLIFTAPLTTLMMAVAYCRMTGQRTTEG